MFEGISVVSVCSKAPDFFPCSGVLSLLKMLSFLSLKTKLNQVMFGFVLCTSSKLTEKEIHGPCAQCWSKTATSPCMFWDAFFFQNTKLQIHNPGPVHLLEYSGFFLFKSSNGRFVSGFVLCASSKSIEEKIYDPCARCQSKTAVRPCMFWSAFFS